MNLLRQELSGTCIYLELLQKSTSETDKAEQENSDSDEEKLAGIAEQKLATFCEQVLKDASDLQSNIGETANMDIHRVLELRSPIIVKVFLSLFNLIFSSLLKL